MGDFSISGVRKAQPLVRRIGISILRRFAAEKIARHSDARGAKAEHADYGEIKHGDTLALLDDSGPGVITHIWMTIASPEKFHLKKLAGKGN
jgi:hypothetical protein